MNKKSLYQTIVDAKIPYCHHESDLYIPANDQTRAILKEFSLDNSNKSRFINQIEGGAWYDIPFAYEPFWQKVQKRVDASK